MKHTLGYILIALLIGALVSCSTSPLAGNSSEITNGYVVGSIINIDGSPASNTVVRLVPADYDPVKGPPLPESLIDTTNQYGEYSFTISDTGNFNIQAVHLSERTRLLTQGIVIDNQKDTIVLPDDTLKEPGVIKIFLPDTIDTTGAYLYIEGTTIFENLAKSVVDSEGLSIIIDSVPEAEIPGLHYDKINNPANPLLLSDTLQVTSNDTFVTEAFVFWINYTQTNSGLPGGVILDIYKAYGETMWFATNAEGVAVFNGTGWAVYDTNNSQIPSNIVHEVIRDNAGLMWFATQGGVASFDGITWTTYTADNSDMPGNFATIIDFDSKGIIWIGMNDDGLVKYDGSQFTVYDTATSGIADNNITHLEIDANDNIWCGSSKGAIKFDGTSWEVFDTVNSGIYADRIYGVKIVGSGDIWFAHQYGVSKFDGATWTTFDAGNSSILDTVVLSICEDRYGNIWIGSKNGLTRYDGAQWLNYTGERWPLLNNIQIYVVYVDNDDNKWLGTFAKGVIGFGPTIK